MKPGKGVMVLMDPRLGEKVRDAVYAAITDKANTEYKEYGDYLKFQASIVPGKTPDYAVWDDAAFRKRRDAGCKWGERYLKYLRGRLDKEPIPSKAELKAGLTFEDSEMVKRVIEKTILTHAKELRDSLAEMSLS